MNSRRSAQRIGLALIGAAALAVTACSPGGSEGGGTGGGSGGDPIEVSVWHGFTEADGGVVQAIADEYNASQDTYEVTIEVNPWNVITDKLLPAVASGNGPDVVVQGVDAGQGYVDQGVFVSMQDFYDDPAYESDSYYQHVVDYSVYDGETYAVPMGYAPFSVWYNKEMFEKAGVTEFPTTQDAWIDLAEKLTVDENGDGTPEIYGLSMGDKQASILPTLLQGGGGYVYTDGEVTLDTPENVETLQWWRDAYQRGWGPTNVSLPESVDLFKAGKSAMTVIGPWIISGAESVGLDIGVFEMPAGSEKVAAWAAANYWWVTSQADEETTKGAYEFLAYFNNYDSQVKWALEGNYPPNRTDITSEDVAANPFMETMLKFTENTYVRLAGLPGGATDVDAELDTLSVDITSGTDDVATLVTEADATLTEILSEFE